MRKTWIPKLTHPIRGGEHSQTAFAFGLIFDWARTAGDEEMEDLDLRVPALAAAAREHREAGLAAVTGEHYEGGHWLASFAMYLVTARGGGKTTS